MGARWAAGARSLPAVCFMKVLIITNLYPPLVQGGAEVIVARTAHELRRIGHEVVVVTTAPVGRVGLFRASRSDDSGVLVYRFFPLNLYHYSRGGRMPWPLRALWRCIDILNPHSWFLIRRILVSEKPDVVITHNLTGIGLCVAPLVMRLSIPHIHVLHDVQLYNPSGVITVGRENTVAQRLYTIVGYRKLMRWFFRNTALFLSPSQFLIDFYRTRGYFVRQACLVMPNPVIIPEHHARADVHNGQVRFASLGSVSLEKGIPQACATLSASLQRYGGRYSIIGDGHALNELKNLYKNSPSIRFYGKLSVDDAQRSYAEIDCLVVPSMLYDASPTVIYEALSYGIPVIASDSGGAREIVAPGVTGWLFKPGDWAELQRIAEDVLREPQKLSRMRDACRASVLNLSALAYVERLVETIQTQILHPARGSR